MALNLELFGFGVAFGVACASVGFCGGCADFGALMEGKGGALDEFGDAGVSVAQSGLLRVVGVAIGLGEV